VETGAALVVTVMGVAAGGGRIDRLIHPSCRLSGLESVNRFRQGDIEG